MSLITVDFLSGLSDEDLQIFEFLQDHSYSFRFVGGWQVGIEVTGNGVTGLEWFDCKTMESTREILGY